MGKTSTKDILAAICAPQRRTVAAERSYNAEIGVPLTIGRVEPDTELVHPRARDARLRPDRRALRVRPAGRRRDHERRPRAPREGRRPRRRRPGEGRADRGAPGGRDRRRPRGLPGRARRPRRRPGRRRRRVFDPPRAADALRRRSRSASRPATSPGTRSPRSRPRTRSASRRPSASRSSSPSGGTRSCRSPAAASLINDAWNANPVSMRAGARAPRRARRRTADDRACSATWPSSARTRPRVIARSARAAAELVDEVVAIGPQARRVRRPPRRHGRGGARAARGDAPPRRLRARQGRPGDGARARRRRAHAESTA